MSRNRKAAITIAAVMALAAGASGTAIAVTGTDDGEGQAKGAGADQARTAALAVTGGGRANSVERDAEDGASWEVEVTRPDGQRVDVRLDDRLELVVVEADYEAPDGDE